MSWKIYEVVFRIKSPIHIGYRKYRNLMQTRLYVPARVLLGALTFKITREIFGQTKEWKHYQAVREVLKQVFTSSYFYPTTNEKGKIEKFPWEEDFPAYKFIGSYVSTAIDTEKRAALEGSLHEVEYISPKTRDTGDQVYLSGYFFIKKDMNSNNIRENFEREPKELLNLNKSNVIIDKIIAKINEWKDLTQSLQIGGERNYGWGFIERERVCEIENNKIFCKYKCKCKYKVILEGNRPIIEISKNENIPAHLIVNKVNKENKENILASGKIEPLVRREWRDKPGSTIVLDGVAYEPGARTIEELKLSINPLGYLQSPI